MTVEITTEQALSYIREITYVCTYVHTYVWYALHFGKCNGQPGQPDRINKSCTILSLQLRSLTARLTLASRFQARYRKKKIQRPRHQERNNNFSGRTTTTHVCIFVYFLDIIHTIYYTLYTIYCVARNET